MMLLPLLPSLLPALLPLPLLLLLLLPRRHVFARSQPAYFHHSKVVALGAAGLGARHHEKSVGEGGPRRPQVVSQQVE
jgi:hypothetical protein